MGVAQMGEKVYATAKPKNPGATRMEFRALEARVAALEAKVALLVGRSTEEEEPEDGKPGDDGQTVKELRARLKELGVQVPAGSKKDGLLELLAKAEKE